MPIQLNGATSGSVTLTAAAVAGNNTLTAPATTGTIVTSADSGVKVLLNTLTASSSAALQDTASLSATYSAYEIECINMKPATVLSSLYLQVYSGGTFQAASYNSSNTFNNSTGVAAAQITLVNSSGNTTAAAESGITGSAFIKVPSQTTMFKMLNGFFSWTTGDTNGTIVGQMMNLTSGYWGGGTGAITGFQVYFSAGNIASGTVKVWGIK